MITRARAATARPSSTSPAPREALVGPPRAPHQHPGQPPEHRRRLLLRPGPPGVVQRLEQLRLRESGLRVRPVDPAEQAAQAVHTLLDLHEQQWADRPINPEHTRERFRRHLGEAMRGMIRDGQAAIFRYRHDGRVVASNLVVVGHRFAGAYLYGATPELRTMVDVSLILVRQDLATGRERDLQVVSFLRGEEPYKLKWRPNSVQNERLILGRSPPAIAFAGVARARLAARRYLRGTPTPTRPRGEANE